MRWKPLSCSGEPGSTTIQKRTTTKDPRGDDAYELFIEVAEFARHRPPAQVGRNDRCPCGSGRKYKACHLGKERHALIDRAFWLYAKHHRYLRDHDRRLVAMLADQVSAASGRGYEFLIDLLDTPLVADIALCEGGIGESFVAERDAVPARRRGAPRRAMATHRTQPVRSRRGRADLPEAARSADR